MRAIRIIAPEKTEIFDIPEPNPGREDVLLDLRYIGLCGSDLNIYRGLMPMVTYPRIPGHEISALIIKKGKNVPDSIKLDDKVMVSPYTNCGVCPACRIGRTNTCVYNQTFGVQRDGALTERMAIHYSKVYASKNLSLQELALVEPLSVGYHATNRGKVSEVDAVLVIGCGTIGIGAIAACVRKGATVIATDIDDAKLDLARQFGAEYTINFRKEGGREKINDLTNNEGVNVAIEAAGVPATFQLAVEAVAYAGRVVFIGYTKDLVDFDTKQFVRKELSIAGSRNALHVFPSVVKMLEKRQQPFLQLISRTYALEQTGQALADWYADPANFMKILIKIKN